MSVTNLQRPKPVTLQRPIGDIASSALTAWTRPSAWLSLPDVTGQQMFAGLYLIAKDGNFVALSASGNYTVNWGDGTSTNHSAGTVAYKEYNYADIASTGESELGYRQAIITVTPQAGQNLTALSLQHRHNRTGLNTAYFPLWLDIAINGSNLASLNVGGGISLIALQRVAILNHALTNMSDMFLNCSALVDVSLPDTQNVTLMSRMFNNCYSLTAVPFFDTQNVTNMSDMFLNCSALVDVPLFNTQNVTSMSSMFSSCSALTTVPLFNTQNVTSMSSMFSSCAALVDVPLFNTQNVTNMSSMFSGCSSLPAVPLFNTQSATNMSSMFFSCADLITVPLFDTQNVTLMSSMFNNCYSLTAVPLFNTQNVTNMSSMFSNCRVLRTVPLFNTQNVTNMTSMFYGCSSLTAIPLFNTQNVTIMSNMLANCFALTYVPALNANAVTSPPNMFKLFWGQQSDNVSWVDIQNMRVDQNFEKLKLSKAALDNIFTNLSNGMSGRTITISDNYGADTTVNNSATFTHGSKTVTGATLNTSTLAIGMRVIGRPVTDAVVVTFQDPGDTVTRTTQAGNIATSTPHGLANGTVVAFTSLQSITAGIATYVPYYVVNATTDTFQLASTVGGAPLAITASSVNAYGNMIYPTYITAILSSNSFEMSAPAPVQVDEPFGSTSTRPFSCRVLDTFPAIAKGWTVSG
jgi:surface protein